MDNVRELIEFIENLGIEVNTSTKARGHQGFYMKNRIDISKNVNPNRAIPILLHEFAHYIHSQIEPQMFQNGGSIEVIFDDNCPDFYIEELIKVTNIVDKNSKCEKLKFHKTVIKEKIAVYEKIIKEKYPKFQRSKKFKEFDKYIKGSNARYLLKFDRVKLITGRNNFQLLTLDNIEKDFQGIPEEFAAYIRLKSCQRRQSRVSSRINRLNKYYSKPTELFARFVEGLYLEQEKVKEIAPNCYKRFFELLNAGYYGKLFDILKMVSVSPLTM